jgi:hypothetical protein
MRLPQQTAGSARCTVVSIATRSRRHRTGWRKRQFPQHRSMPVENLLDGIAEIVDDMEEIRNLDCLWGVTCRPLSIGRTPVACQDLNTGMCFEPTGDQMIAPPDLLVVASATGLV